MELEYKVFYRKVKYPRIEIKSGELRVIVPYGVKAEEVVERHRRWIEKKLGEIEKVKREAAKLRPLKRGEAEFRELVTGFIHEAETVLGVKANRIIFRRMKARWASCSAQGNITVNRLARVIPPELLRYIAFHEVAHLIYKNHGKGFHDLLSKVFPDHRTLERQLQQWWFVIH